MNNTSKNSSKTNRLLLHVPHPLLLTACILIVIGYILMSGTGSNSQSFNPDIFSFRRVVAAPMLCLAGYLLIIIGILRYK